MAHQHDLPDYTKAFAVGVLLNTGFVLLEATVGLLVNSLALLADAGHNLSDVLSLLLAWGATYLTKLPPTKRRTYGWRKSSVLAALFNGLLLLVAMGGIVWEAVQRFQQPQEIAAQAIIWVAGAGVVINTLTALLFMKGRAHDLNIRGAFLHMAADAGVSAGVVAAGFAIQQTGLAWIDPATSLLVVVVIVIGTWGLLKDAINLAMDAVPERIDPEQVENYLAALPGIAGVHDLHIWPVSTTEVALTAHLIKPDGRIDDKLLAKACHELHEKFRIEHVTIQVESQPDDPCEQRSPEAL